MCPYFAAGKVVFSKKYGLWDIIFGGGLRGSAKYSALELVLVITCRNSL
jgi:hypothetical protein